MSYIGNIPADKYLTLEKQTFTTSATDTYTLDREVSSVNDIELFLNNVRQEPTEAYTISGTTLTLASTITASDSMYCIYQGRAVGTQSPAVGSVTNDMLAGSIANAKLANSSITLNGSAVSLGGSATILEGITDIDRWRVATTFTNSLDPIVYTRNTDSDSPQLGSAMTQSSGIFSFPSIGFWLIHAFYTGANLPSAGNINAHLSFSTNSGGSYTQLTAGLQNSGTYSQWSITNVAFIDVTDISTFRVKSYINVPSSAETYGQNNGPNLTRIDFLRIGDT